eukprot:TRINITY_DN675_c0_g1_i11.p1 TRINITY_DN675_c0_g1~~TRINITY_DN675_c0_g1_i11.p1  ORF type:complete len:208 (-),score=28.92 TRINITY_DN675_c0_g1_i11:195-818(-)
MLRKALRSSVVFVRHGESQWNKENRFTGWHDVPLSEAGKEESILAGQKIKESRLRIDVAFCSMQKRTVTCFNLIADVLDIHHVPVCKSYRLNERHYGALEGLNKAEMIQKYGKEKVKLWTRSFCIKPPAGPSTNMANGIYLPGTVPQTEVYAAITVVAERHSGACDAAVDRPNMLSNNQEAAEYNCSNSREHAESDNKAVGWNKRCR